MYSGSQRQSEEFEKSVTKLNMPKSEIAAANRSVWPMAQLVM